MRWAHAWRLALCLLMGVAFAGGARAWTGIAPQNPVWTGTVPYKLNMAGSDDLPLDTVEAEVVRAMGDWARQSCTSLSVRYDGLTSEQPSGNNTIAFMESGWTAGPVTLGITSPRMSFFPTSAIVSADMWLNGQDHTWVVGQPFPGQLDTYSIVLHEGGHYYGLGHTLAPGSTMAAAYNNSVFVLGPDDIEGICTLYPGDGSPRDCTATGCMPGEQCVAGACQADVPEPAQGACGVDADCDAGQRCDAGSCAGASGSPAACSADGDCGAGQRCDAGSCAEPSAPAQPPPGSCALASDCAAGERCDAGVCVPQLAMPPTAADQEPGGVAEPGATLPMGAPCTFDDECQGGLCRLQGERALCTGVCRSDADCGAGTLCDGDPSLPTCVPAVILVPAKHAPGAAPTRGAAGDGAGGCSVARRGLAAGRPSPVVFALAVLAMALTTRASRRRWCRSRPRMWV